ncbi:pre-mrna cleavage complex ii protein clp1 [Ophiostoma piceae UAMH 11346]|uniref:Polynucleotide 5'-hydroxyl-kinase GRC3 n=1 Tax=Ophiostoma piceae (strain UAMH 11346) TaxID=1262450 RepID=S3CJY2_OPHP1|nr:pre-mrna cleavage complex ii protein clp1 [Ophiostoma piceae UAMH 11346]
MSIPGLGQIPVQTSTTSARTLKLTPLSEWRFTVGQPPIKVRLLNGTAERDGTELAANQPYSFAGVQSKILTWHGCEIEVEGNVESSEVVAGGSKVPGVPSPQISYMNLHMLLASQRARAATLPQSTGPRLLVCGPPHAGRTTLVRSLTAWATKMTSTPSPNSAPPQQPCVINVDPREGMLSLPGTLSAAVFATLMDLETEGGAGWGGAPSSGPSAVPVKLPLVYNYGYARPSDAPDLYRQLVTRLSGAVFARIAEDPAVKSSGLLIDTPAVTTGEDEDDEDEYMPEGDDDENDQKDDKEEGEAKEPRPKLMSIDLLTHVIEEFSVNMVVVLGQSSESIAIRESLEQRLVGDAATTSTGEPIQVVQLDSSDGVVARTDSVEQQQREACIKEYFFGDTKRTLSPYTQQVDGETLTVFRLPPSGDEGGSHRVVKFEASPALAHWTLAVMNAGLHDPPDVVQQATVQGFVYVAEVDGERRKVRVLAPVSGRLGDRPLVFGRWPEPYINLVG